MSMPLFNKAYQFFDFLNNRDMGAPGYMSSGKTDEDLIAEKWVECGADPAKFNAWYYNLYRRNLNFQGGYTPTTLDYSYFERPNEITEIMHAKVEGPFWIDPRPNRFSHTRYGYLNSKCNNPAAVAFVHKYKKAAQTTADNLDVPLENILGLAASESRYGAPTNPDGSATIAVRDNNYFSMHALSGNQQYDKQHGVDISHAKNPKDRKRIAKFDSFDDNVHAFEKYWGKFVRGKKDPRTFGQALVDAKYNTERANFVENLVNVIDAVRARLQCPEI